VRRRMLFSFSENLNPLRIHYFFQVGKSMGISITHLVIYGVFSIPRLAFPLIPIIGLVQIAVDAVTHTKKSVDAAQQAIASRFMFSFMGNF
jgi:hypothetical protein